MHLISTSRPEVVGGFIHVPVLPEQVSEETGAPAWLSDDITRGDKIRDFDGLGSLKELYSYPSAVSARSHQPRTSSFTSIPFQSTGAYQSTLSRANSFRIIV